MGKTVLQLGPDDAGMLLTADEFADADYQGPFTTALLPGLEVPLTEVFQQ